jgi:hypothetical protein
MTRPPEKDDEATAHDLVAPTYEQAPPTLEIQPSPFHRLAAPQPRITSKNPTEPFGAGIIQAPTIRTGDYDAMAGPTDPDGHQILSFDAADPSFPSGPWVDATPTQPGAKPTALLVPSPDAPNILVSQSLILEAASRSEEETPPPRMSPKARRRAEMMPTEVALPAIKRKKAREKEGSDVPLILGLIGVGLLIAIVVAAVSYIVVRTMTPDPPRVIQTTR